MDIVKIQTLIAQDKVVKLSDVNPTESFIQLGVYQPNNRRIGSGNADTYPSVAMALSEIASLISQPQSGIIYHDAYTQGSVTLVISTIHKPKYIIFGSNTEYILDGNGVIIKTLTDPVGPHATTFFGLSVGNGYGSDYANITALNFYKNILVQDPLGLPLGTIPNSFVIQQPTCFLNGMRWEDETDAGTYGTCTNFTDNSFTLTLTPYGNYPFISTINWTAFF